MPNPPTTNPALPMRGAKYFGVENMSAIYQATDLCGDLLQLSSDGLSAAMKLEVKVKEGRENYLLLSDDDVIALSEALEGWLKAKEYTKPEVVEEAQP